MSRGFYEKAAEMGLIPAQSSNYTWSAERGMSRGFDAARRKLGLYTVEYDTEDYINSFLSDYNTFYQKWASNAENAGWSDAMSGSSQMQKEYGNLQKRSGIIRKYLDQNRDWINPDYYDEAIANLDTAGSGYQDLQDAYSSLSEYYGQWGSQEEYDTWKLNYEAQQEAKAQYEQYQQDKQRLQELLAERDRRHGLISDISSSSFTLGFDFDSLWEGQQSFEDLNAEISQLQASVDEYEAGLWSEGHTGEAGTYLDSTPAADGLTAEAREQRLAEIGSQIYDLERQNVGYERGLPYDATGNLSRKIQANEQKIAELEEEKRTLLLSGASTEREYLGYQNEFAQQDYAAAFGAIQSTARIGTPEAIAETQNSGRRAAEANAERFRLADTIHWLDYVDEYTGKKYDDNFFGQYQANRMIGRLSQDSSLYWDAYLFDPSEENRRMAETADEMIQKLSIINSETLADDGTLPWISRDLANYMPQFWDQLKYKVGGGLAGAALTFGNPWGAKAGYVSGSALYGYQTMRGAAFRELIKAGMDEDTARAAATDEAVISSLIEAGDAILDLVALGAGSAIDLATKGGETAVKNWLSKAAGKNVVTKLLTALGKYALNAGGEYLEESTQEAVSIANQERDTSGILDLAARAISTYLLIFNADSEEEQDKQAQMREAGMGGLRLGLMLGGGEMVGNAAVGSVVGNIRAEMEVGALRPKLQELTAKTLELNPNDKNALRVQARLEQGKNVSGMDIYKMLLANEEAAAKKDAEIVREAVASRLTELGEQGDIDAIAEAVSRLAAGEELRRRDFALIQESKYAQQIVRELNLLGNNEGSSLFYNKTEGAQWRDNVNTLRKQSRDYAMDLSGNVVSPDVQRIINRLIRDGVGEQEAAETARKLSEAGKIYGKQADVFTNSYLKGQSVEQYRLAFANIYQAGKDGTSRELIKDYGKGLTEAQKELAYLAGQKAGGNNKALQSIQEDDALDVNAEGKTIRTDTNEDIEPTGFESVGENGMLATKGGQSVSIRSVAFASYDDAVLYNTIAKVSSSANIANTLLKQFQAQDSLSAIDFAAALMEAYEAGEIGEKTALELKDAEFAGKLTTGQREVVYNRGKRAAYQQAYQRQQDVKKKSGGKKEGKLHFDRKGRKFDSVRESSLAVMDTLSKALGVDIYVYESYVNEKGQRVYLSDRGEKKAPNGYYDPSDGSIHIDLNAGQSGKGTMLFTVAHELTHFIKDWSSVKYRALADALVKQYQKQGVTVSELVDNQIAKAEQNGREMSRPEAFDEVVADSMESMLTDENAAAFLEKLAQRDKGLKEKIVSWLKELAAKLKNALSAYKDAEPDSPEGKMVAEMEDFRKEIMGIYTSALVDAGENFRENGGNKKATRDESVAHETAVHRSDRIVDQIRNSLQKIMELDSVYTIDASNAIPYTSDRKTDEKSGHAVFKAQGGVANRTGFGRVVLSKRGVVHTIYHGNGPAKQAAFPAIKAVVEHGIEIYRENNHDNQGYDTITLSAPISFFGSDVPMAVVVKSFYSANSDKTFYIHEICDAEGNYIQFEDADFEQKNSNTNFVEPTSTVSAADNGIAPKNSIRNPEQVVKKNVQMSDRDSDGRQLSEGQREYFKDSVVRDADGNLLVMYHGTPNGVFTEFHSGTYFTQNPEYATLYQSPGASMLRLKRNADNPKNYQVYLDIKKPFDTRKSKERRIFMEEYYRKYGTGAPLSESGLPDWTDGMDLQEFIEDMGYDYDGLILDEGATGGYGEEVKSRGLSYVIFSPEQVKDVDNKNPSTNPDYRFSDRDPTAEATRAALEKENGKLREDVSRLRELLRLQGKVTGGTVMKPSSVEAAAKWLNKYAGAKADVKELSRMLNDFYRFIATDKDYSWEDVHQQAMVIAKYLQDNVQLKPQISDYARDVLRDIRGTKITLDDSQRAKAEYQYGSYEAFRKAAFGNVTFVKEGGIPLDRQWHEWASLYPGTFDSEITASDQPRALMEIIDEMRNSDTTVTEYAYNRESIAQDLAVAVYDSYWRVDALVTVADRDQRKINDLTARHEALKGTISEKNAQIKKLRAEHRTEMDKLKNDRNETIAALKQKRQEDMKKLRTDYRKKLEDTRTRYQESREKAVDSRNRAKMREQVKKTVNELNHLLLDGDKKRHVPESMRKAVAEILSAVNMETSTAEARSAAFERTVARYNQRIKMENDPAERARLEAARDAYIGKGDQFKAKIDALAKAYEDIKESADPGLQDAYSDAVSQYLFTLEARVGDTRLGDMTLDQLKTVQNVLRIVMSTIRNANKSFLNERAGTIEQQAKRCISEVSSTWRKKKEGESDVGRWLRGFHYRNLKPIYLMRAIGSDALTQAYNNLRRGEDTWYRDIQEGREFFLSQAGKYGYREWDFEKTTPFSDNSGGEVKLTLGQIMCLYAYAKQGDDTAEHLRIGGVVPEGEAVRVNRLKMKVTYHLNDATPHQLGPDEIGKIIGTLTKEQTDFADAMQDYLSTVMADKGNEVSLAMYGIKLFTMKDYFPIKSAEQYVNQKNEPVGEVKLKNSGFTNKRKPGSNNPIVLRDFMDVWADHVNEMSNYHAFVLAIEDFNRIINYQTARKEGAAPVSLKQTIQNYMGQEAVSAVRELIQDVNGGARVDPAATFASKAINMFKKNAVFASASVVIQQPSAIVRAAALIDPKYFSGKIIDREKVDPTWETIKKYAPVAGIKDMGYFDTNMGKSTVDYIKGPEHDGVKDVLTGIVKREKGSFDELLSMAPGYADKVTWCAIWEAVKRETAAKHPNLATRSEEFLKICGDRFTEVITKTQVYDSVFARSGNMRSKDTGIGMATSFMAEPTTSINMIYDAVLQWKRGDKAYMRRAIGAVIGAAVLNAVLKSIVYAERDEDEDETYGEKYVSALVAALKDDVLFLVPNSIPFVRDIMSLVQGYSVERMDMELADDLISAVKKLYSEKASSEEKILGVLGSFGNLLFPAKNMIREVKALINVIDTFRNSESQTAMGIRNAIREGWSGKTVSNARQLYEARMAGDTAHEERIAARYENEKSANAAVVSAIKEAFMGGDLSEQEAQKHLILYGNTDAGDAYWKVKEWIYAKDKGTTDGYGKYNDLYDAILNGGDIQAAVEEFTENGYDEDEVMSNVKKEVGRWFWDDESETRISAEQASDILEKYFGMKQDEIQETILKWTMKKETGISYSELREAFQDDIVSEKEAASYLEKYGGMTQVEAQETILRWKMVKETGIQYDDLKEAVMEQSVSESDAIAYLKKYGGMTEYDAKERVADWRFEAEHGYAYDDIKATYLDEEITRAEAIAVMTEIGGKSREDAEKKVAYWDYEEKTGVDYENKAQQYKRGIITRQQLRQALIDLGEYSGEDADIQIEVYDWEQSGLRGASFTRVKNWHEYCEPAGVSRDMWLKIALFSANTENDKDEDGNSIRYSAMKKVMAEINKLPISKEQKTAIARAIGWSEKNIAKYKPW